MPKVLHVKASPRGMSSDSTKVAEAFLEAFLKAHRNFGVEELDLFRKDLPPFEAPAAAAKYAVFGGGQPRGPDALAWKAVIEVVDHFKSADVLVISSPMWNFGIPYRLKHYLDLLVQPGLTFSYGPEGYKGLVTSRLAVLILSRGGSYPAGDAMDFQRPYLETILRFVGFSDIRTVLIEPTLSGADAKPIVAGAMAAARELAARI
jgi:FMN-dependent NADH-azoreductase